MGTENMREVTRRDELEAVGALRLSAALVASGAALSGPVALLVVLRFAPQPAWNGVVLFAEHYDPLQVLPYALGYVLLAGFVLFTAACHARAEGPRRVRTTVAVIFTGIYATLVFTNYTIQLGVIPRLLAERPAYLASLTMANPASFAWFLEMFGYAALGVATWSVAAGFGGSRRGHLIRILLIGNGVVSIAGAACTAAIDRFVFTTAGLVAFGAWNALILLCYVLIAVTPDGGTVRALPSAHA
jgi:hypothetical protein